MSAQTKSPRHLTIVFLLSLPFFIVGSALIYIIWTAGDTLPNLDTEGLDPFDSQKWKDADPESGEREAMLRDLFKNHVRPGMSRQQVLNLLGKPTPRDHYPCFQAPPEDTASTLCYTVSLGLDPCTLLLAFDAQGRFIHHAKSCS